MKRHFLGFAVFILILISSVLLQTYFYYSSEILVEKPYVTDSSWKIQPKTSNENYSFNSKTESPISYKLQDWSFDTNENILKANVKLNWNGAGKQPDAIAVQFNFFSLDNPSKEIRVATESILAPFQNANSITKNITALVDKKLINPEKNYYGTINVWGLEFKENNTQKMNGRMTFIQLNDKVKLAEAVPVLMIYKK